MVGREIGDEAVRRRMRDEERQLRVFRRGLRGDATGPEHGGEPFGHRRHVATEQWIAKIRADRGRVADMDRGPMVEWKADNWAL